MNYSISFLLLVRKTLLTLLLYSSLVVSIAQPTIHGIVTDMKDSKPLAGCSVLVRDTIGDILRYSITSDEGAYSLELKGLQNNSYLLEVAILGYTKQRMKFDRSKFVINFALQPSPIELKEIKITAPRINQKGDTITYNVSGFKESQDRVIGDVLKKIPGIDVSQEGVISFNGKAINKFYIEGIDLLEGKYTLATNNIPTDAVSSVQIFENHQDIKALQNKVFSDKVALNLKLTDHARSEMLWRMESGVGLSPILWDANLLLMQFSKKNQGLSVYKTNNIGNDISSEVKVLTVESLKDDVGNKIDEPDLVSVPVIESPELSSNRFLFNKTHIVSSNNLFHLRNDYQLRINLDYMKDHTSQTNSNYIQYFGVNDSSIIIRENYQTVKSLNIVDAAVTLTANKSNYYFHNSFSLKNRWNNTEVQSVCDDWEDQKLDIPQQTIKNDFTLIKTRSDRTILLRSFNFYNSLPQSLLITPGLYAAEFNQSKAYDGLIQNSKMNSIFSNTSFSVKKNKGHWGTEYLASLVIQSQTMHTGLEKIDNDSLISLGDSFANNYKLNHFQCEFKPILEYLGEKLKLSLEMPMRYNLLKTNDQKLAQAEIYQRLNILPKLNIFYKINPLCNIRLGYGYSVVTGDIREFTQGFMLYDYRTLIKNSGILKEQKTQTFSFGVFYKNPVKALFSGISLIYMPSTSNTIFDTRIESALTRRIQSYKYNTRNLWMINGQMSKMLDVFPITLRLDVSINHSNLLQLFQNSLTEYDYFSMQFKPRVHLRIASWSNIDYDAQLSQSKFGTISPFLIKYDPVNRITQKLSWFFIPSKISQFWVKGEYLKGKSAYYTSPVNFFIDAGFQQLFDKASISVEWRNILNVKEYSYSTFDDISFSTKCYELRPSEFLIKFSFTL